MFGFSPFNPFAFLRSVFCDGGDWLWAVLCVVLCRVSPFWNRKKRGPPGAEGDNGDGDGDDGMLR